MDKDKKRAALQAAVARRVEVAGAFGPKQGGGPFRHAFRNEQWGRASSLLPSVPFLALRLQVLCPPKSAALSSWAARSFVSHPTSRAWKVQRFAPRRTAS